MVTAGRQVISRLLNCVGVYRVTLLYQQQVCAVAVKGHMTSMTERTFSVLLHVQPETSKVPIGFQSLDDFMHSSVLTCVVVCAQHVSRGLTNSAYSRFIPSQICLVAPHTVSLHYAGCSPNLLARQAENKLCLLGTTTGASEAACESSLIKYKSGTGNDQLHAKYTDVV